jgi:hypothetical protein
MGLDARGRRLRVALAAVLVKAHAPELKLMHALLDTWAGIGLVVVGMAHQTLQVGLGEHGIARWITGFYRPAGGHKPIEAAGTAQEATPSGAVPESLAIPRSHLK